MYALLTNDAKLSAARVLAAHKGQPRIEKRFEQLETVHEIAPVFLKNEARIEALFTLYFLALLVQGLIERQLRVAMHAAGIEALPLYPEARVCRRPTTEQILRLFSPCERITISAGGEVVRVVAPRPPRCSGSCSNCWEYRRRPTRLTAATATPAAWKFGVIVCGDVRNVGLVTASESFSLPATSP
jgi:hypothetical protein